MLYAVMRNSDLTEGRGHNILVGVYENLDDAVEEVKKWGVMGVGTGDIYEVKMNSADSYGSRIWGYRKDLADKWGYGFVDNRDAPFNDPEFNEYLRLKKKFGG